MAIIAQDNFTEAVDTDIELHISDNPGANPSWDADAVGSQPIVEADQNELRGATDSDRYARHTADVGDDKMDVSANCKISTNADRRCGLTARVPAGESGVANCYTCYLTYDGKNVDAGLDKIVATVTTNLGSYALDGTAGTFYALKLQIRTDAKKLYIDGVERISSVDDVLTGNNFAGVRIRRSSADIRIDSFVLESVDTPAPPAPPAAVGARQKRRLLSGVGL